MRYGGERLLISKEAPMRTILTYCRAWAAMGVAWGATASAAGVAVFVGIPYGLCVDSFIGRWVPNPFAWIPFVWAAFVTHVCARGILGVRVVVRGTVAPAHRRELVLCIGNHPSALGMPIVGWVITRYLAARIVAVGKREHVWNPFIGWPLMIARAVILINRRDRAAARASIRNGLRQLGDAARALIIFPDMRRPTPARIAADCAKFADRIPNIRAWLRYTLVPRTGGLAEILQSVHQSVRIIHVTGAFDVEEFGVTDASRVIGRTYYVDVVEQSDPPLPTDDAALACALNVLWEEKNRRIATWRSARY